MGTGDEGRAEAPPNPHRWRCPPATAREGGGGEACLCQQIFLEGESRCPRSPPPTWGPSVRAPCAAMPGQVAKGAGFTFPRGTTVAWSLPVPLGPAFPELVTEHHTKELILPRKGGTSILRSGPRRVSPPPCLPGEVSPLTPSSCSCRGIYSSPALCHPGPGAGPPAGSQGAISLKRQLPRVSSQCTHPEHRDAEAESPSPGEGLGCTLSPGNEPSVFSSKDFSILATHPHHLGNFQEH